MISSRNRGDACEHVILRTVVCVRLMLTLRGDTLDLGGVRRVWGDGVGGTTFGLMELSRRMSSARSGRLRRKRHSGVRGQCNQTGGRNHSFCDPFRNHSFCDSFTGSPQTVLLRSFKHVVRDIDDSPRNEQRRGVQSR